MKHRILAVIVILISILSITVSATTFDYSISLDSNYTVAKYGENLDALSKKMGVTTQELTTYFEENSLVYAAISNDAKTQIKISVIENALTDVSDISQLSDNALNEFAKSISQENTEIVVNNNRKFVCSKTTSEDKGGTYTITQYSTIFDQKIVSFIGYNDGNTTSQEIITAFESFSLNEIDSHLNNKSLNLSIIIVIIGIVAFVAIAVVMIIGIVRRIKAHDEY